MLGEITSALGAIKSGYDIIKAMVAAKTEAEIQSKTADLYQLLAGVSSKLMETHASVVSLLGEKSALEKELLELKQARQDLEAYELCQLPTGTFVYQVKADDAKQAPSHSLCAHCYQSNVKSILQPKGIVLHCPACKTDVQAKESRTLGTRSGPHNRWRNI